jgi:hypothetical protein
MTTPISFFASSTNPFFRALISDRAADLGPQVEADIERDLVVPAPARVEFPPGLTDPRNQRLLNGHMDILVSGLEGELPGFDIGQDIPKPDLNRLGLRLRDDPLFGEHPRMGDASLDVVPVKAIVVVNRGREGLHFPIRRFREPPSPGLLLFFHRSLPGYPLEKTG